MRTITVLGGGIGGLAASYYLCKIPHVTKVVVLESSGRFGGWLCSTRRSDGAIFERGPRGIRPAGTVGRNTLNMVDELGLGEDIIPVPSSHSASQNRFLYVKNQLHKMPSGLTGLLRTVPPFSRPLLVSLVSELLVERSQNEDESVHGFVSRRFGMELADIAVDSVCRGVFAGDCRKLSVRSCFPGLLEAEQRRGSVVLGMLMGSGRPTPEDVSGSLAQRSIQESWAQWSLKRGVQSLPESLTEYLQASGRVQLHQDAAVRHIVPSASGWKVHLEDGVITTDYIISALPSKALASTLPSSCRPLSQQLLDIATVTVAVVNLEYHGSVLPVEGFGHLLPSSEDPALLGVVYDSVPFPQHDRPDGTSTRLTVMMGGSWFHQAFGSPDSISEDRLLSRAVKAVRRQLGIAAPPAWSQVSVQQDCIPQYHVGHFRRVESMREFIRTRGLRLSLAGASYDGVSVNDVVFSARTAASRFL